MTKFTPEPLSAPWMYHEAITHDGRATFYLYQIALNSEKTCPVATAYTKPAARLIAAAPDLLAALRGLLLAFESDNPLEADDAAEAAYSAIAKATEE
jgi:hypothetical protein